MNQQVATPQYGVGRDAVNGLAAFGAGNGAPNCNIWISHGRGYPACQVITPFSNFCALPKSVAYSAAFG